MVLMNEQIVLFTEEDTQFRLMETALNGKPSDTALKALHYFFGENIDVQLNYLLSLPSVVGLPRAFVPLCAMTKKSFLHWFRRADYLVFERTDIDRKLMEYGKGKLKFIQKFGSDYRNIDVNAAKTLGIQVAYLSRVTTISVAEHVLTLVLSLSRNLMFAHQAAKSRIHAKDGLRSEGPPQN